jgi:hypothetical protein
MMALLRGVAILTMAGSAIFADSLADQIKRKQQEIVEIHKTLDPLLKPVLVTDANLRVWLSSNVTASILKAYNQATPDKRHFHYDATGETGQLKNSNGGALGCGWYVTIEGGNSAHADLDTSNLNATWNPNATVNAGLDFKFAFNAQVHAHVKGPAGPCSIWHPWPTCDCPIGGGFGTSVGTSGDKGGTIGALATLKSTPSEWLAYDVALVSPSSISITLVASLGQFGDVGIPASFSLPTGVLATGSAPSVLGGQGEVKVGNPPIIDKLYTITVTPSNSIANETGIAVKAAARVQFK